VGDLLTFNAQTHTYRLGSRVLPSVTTILRESELCNFSSPWFTDEVRDRGTRVHAAIEALVNGAEVDDAITVPPLSAGLDAELRPCEELRPYVLAFQQWQRDERMDITGTEVRLSDEALGYAGTIDITGERNGATRNKYVVDVKCGSVPPSVGPQTAAYARLLNDGWWFRASLNLRKDGTYRYDLLEDDQDEDDFLAALRLYHRRRHKYGTR
jgi:hypothetical protein